MNKAFPKLQPPVVIASSAAVMADDEYVVAPPAEAPQADLDAELFGSDDDDDFQPAQQHAEAGSEGAREYVSEQVRTAGLQVCTGIISTDSRTLPTIRRDHCNHFGQDVDKDYN